MLRISALIFLLGLILTSFGQQPEYIQGNVIVQLKDGVDVQAMVNDIASSNNELQTLKVERCIGDFMNVWLLSYENLNCDSKVAAREIARHVEIGIAQVNHIVQDRATEPNDPDFDQQWYHIQNGDHDIDTDLAWDITTGGYTQFGDRIVVCVIEGGGADWEHEDLIENHWGQIPKEYAGSRTDRRHLSRDGDPSGHIESAGSKKLPQSADSERNTRPSKSGSSMTAT